METKLGWESNGIPAGKRDFREGRKDGKQNFFVDPLTLTLDILITTIKILILPFKYLAERLNSKPKSLRGKVCFVTGSGRGLGRELCIALAKEGAIIACADINEENNKATVQMLTEMGAKAKAYKINVANKQDVDAVAKSVENDLGRVYLLVNNAAIVLPSPELTEEYTRATLGVNILGPIWTITAFLPKMKEANEGHILNISSIGAHHGLPFATLYGATKAALTNFSQGLRLELFVNGYNIKITTAHPGLVNTSADYLDALNTRIGYSEVEDVAKWIINSVRYNETDVTNDPIPAFLLSLGRYIPVDIFNQFLKIFKVSVKLPTHEEYKQLKIYDIIQETNAIKTGKKE